MPVLFFLYNFVGKFFILRSMRCDSVSYSHRFSCIVPVILDRFLVKLEFSRQIYEKYTGIKFHENPSSGSRVVP